MGHARAGLQWACRLVGMSALVVTIIYALKQGCRLNGLSWKWVCIVMMLSLGASFWSALSLPCNARTGDQAAEVHVPDSDLEITTMRASGAGAPCIIPLSPDSALKQCPDLCIRIKRLHADA